MIRFFIQLQVLSLRGLGTGQTIGVANDSMPDSSNCPFVVIVIGRIVPTSAGQFFVDGFSANGQMSGLAV
jgi:hypothetical protein